MDEICKTLSRRWTCSIGEGAVSKVLKRKINNNKKRAMSHLALYKLNCRFATTVVILIFKSPYFKSYANCYILEQEKLPERLLSSVSFSFWACCSPKLAATRSFSISPNFFNSARGFSCNSASHATASRRFKGDANFL